MAYTDGRRLVADTYRELVEPLETGLLSRTIVAKFTYRLSSRHLAAMAEEFAQALTTTNYWFFSPETREEYAFEKGENQALDTLDAELLKGKLPDQEYGRRIRAIMMAVFRRRWKSLVASSRRISTREVNELLAKWEKPWPDRYRRVKECRKRVGDSLKGWSRAVRASARGRCQAEGCGAVGTQAHHLIPIEFGGDPFGAGVWLCAKHHSKAHRAISGRPKASGRASVHGRRRRKVGGHGTRSA